MSSGKGKAIFWGVEGGIFSISFAKQFLDLIFWNQLPINVTMIFIILKGMKAVPFFPDICTFEITLL